MKRLWASLLAMTLACALLCAAQGEVYTDYFTVTAVQTALNYGGFDCADDDGEVGKQTKAAIIAYQEANGLEQTGEIDDTLLVSLGIMDMPDAEKIIGEWIFDRVFNNYTGVEVSTAVVGVSGDMEIRDDGTVTENMSIQEGGPREYKWRIEGTKVVMYDLPESDGASIEYVLKRGNLVCKTSDGVESYIFCKHRSFEDFAGRWFYGNMEAGGENFAFTIKNGVLYLYSDVNMTQSYYETYDLALENNKLVYHAGDGDADKTYKYLSIDIYIMEGRKENFLRFVADGSEYIVRDYNLVIGIESKYDESEPTPIYAIDRFLGDWHSVQMTYDAENETYVESGEGPLFNIAEDRIRVYSGTTPDADYKDYEVERVGNNLVYYRAENDDRPYYRVYAELHDWSDVDPDGCSVVVSMYYTPDDETHETYDLRR